MLLMNSIDEEITDIRRETEVLAVARAIREEVRDMVLSELTDGELSAALDEVIRGTLEAYFDQRSSALKRQLLENQSMRECFATPALKPADVIDVVATTSPAGLPDIPAHVSIEFVGPDPENPDVMHFDMSIPLGELKDWYRSVPGSESLNLADQIADELICETGEVFDFGAHAKVGDVVMVTDLNDSRRTWGPLKITAVEDGHITGKSVIDNETSYGFDRDGVVVSYVPGVDSDSGVH